MAIFAAGLVTAATLYLLTWRRGISGNRLVLVGIGVDAFLTAVTLFMLVRHPIDEVSSAVLWTSGTLFDSGWEEVGRLVASLALLVPVALALMGRLQVLQLGDDCARSLGVRAEPARLGLFTVAVGLVSVTVAAAGPIVFVALVIAYVARLLAGPMTAGVLVLAGLLGALLLLGGRSRRPAPVRAGEPPGRGAHRRRRGAVLLAPALPSQPLELSPGVPYVDAC